ncbi:MBL fold metallo-hydrolase [Streptomyces oryzae]|uniref:MBL fold metallo-hydrolase n=1 Tax=Streptomyces oryzae TaxID=1434886 RepID=A0ABS3XHC3_9ACTN|nr:MBL fold metallo-hydrolase [Streptomyces oryzae]MBO8194807.1 MBL fold metallo-hydrolase [Streptomyces oryzae]
MPFQQPTTGRSAGHRPSRRSVLRTGVAAGAVGVAGVAATASATAPAGGAARAGRRRGRSGVRLRWLGIAGWEMTFDGHRLLIDPYLTRQRFTGSDGKADMTRKLEVDHRIIDLVLREHLTGAPEFVLLTHGHWDHLADVPYLLDHPDWRGKEINILGTETHLHLLTAMGVPGKGVHTDRWWSPAAKCCAIPSSRPASGPGPTTPSRSSAACTARSAATASTRTAP